MKLTRFALPAAVLAVMLGLWWTRSVRAQATAAVRPAWEFATVEYVQEGWQGRYKVSVANICYHTMNGCHWETLTTTVDRWGRMNDAVASAFARLGAKGYEPSPLATGHDVVNGTVLFQRPLREEQ